MLADEVVTLFVTEVVSVNTPSDIGFDGKYALDVPPLDRTTFKVSSILFLPYVDAFLSAVNAYSVVVPLIILVNTSMFVVK